MDNGPVAAGRLRRRSLCATASLLCGILGWLGVPIVGAVGAIIFGHSALRAMARANGMLRGHGLATLGLVLGYGQLALIVMLVGMRHLPPQLP